MVEYNPTEKVYIKVFVTKTKEFRAEISQIGKPGSEITVGGQNWRRGYFKEFHGRILGKCTLLLENLNRKLVSELERRDAV